MILGIKGETYHADDETYFMLSERTVEELIDLIDSRIEEKGKVKGIEIEINYKDKEFVKKIADVVVKTIHKLLNEKALTNLIDQEIDERMNEIVATVDHELGKISTSKSHR